MTILFDLWSYSDFRLAVVNPHISICDKILTILEWHMLAKSAYLHIVV